jgi:hypothetical protein
MKKKSHYFLLFFFTQVKVPHYLYKTYHLKRMKKKLKILEMPQSVMTVTQYVHVQYYE